MLKKLVLLQMMLITELMQGGDLGTKLRSDRETPRKTGWHRQGCYYALGVARSGASPSALHQSPSGQPAALHLGACLSWDTSAALLMVACGALPGQAAPSALYRSHSIGARCQLLACQPCGEGPRSQAHDRLVGAEYLLDIRYWGTVT